MVTIKPRSAWTPTAPSGAIRTDAKAVTHFLIHHPAMGKTIGANLTETQVIAKLNAWRTQHIGQGWGDIGYNYAIDQRGNVWELRGTRIGAQAKNFNSKSIGVLLIIGDEEKPTPEAVASAHALRYHLKATFPNLSNMMGHGEAPGQATSCPGKLTMPVVGWVQYVPPANPTPTTAPELKRGVKSPEVGTLQDGLNRLLKLNVDNDYGDKTEAMVKEFQRQAGLPATGRVDNATGKALAARGVKGLGW